MRAWIVVGAVVASLLPLQRAGAGDGRSYVAGHFALVLDGGRTTGFLQSVSGGAASAEVMEEVDPTNPNLVTKQIGTPKYEDFTVQFDVGAGQPMKDWIDAMLAGKAARKNGAVVAADFNRKVLRQAEFQDALLTEFKIPACDATAKDPAYLSIKFAPESTKWTDGAAETLPPPNVSKQKSWNPANFRVKIGDLPCSRVTKIDAFTIKQGTVGLSPGQSREYTKEPGKLEIPNLKITIAAVDLEPWADWHDDFVIKGNCQQDKELGGQLEFLAPNMQDVLLTLDFKHLGIFKLTELPEPSAQTTAHVRVFTVDLYVETMELK
jgi:hypothetical protein